MNTHIPTRNSVKKEVEQYLFKIEKCITIYFEPLQRVCNNTTTSIPTPKL